MVASIEESLKRFEEALDKLQAAIEHRVSQPHAEGKDDGSPPSDDDRNAALAEAQARADRLSEANAQLSTRITALIAEVRAMVDTTDAGRGE